MNPRLETARALRQIAAERFAHHGEADALGHLFADIADIAERREKSVLGEMPWTVASGETTEPEPGMFD